MSASEKLIKEAKVVYGGKEECIKTAVLNALVNFCEQEAEFAQAIEQLEETFQACLSYVVEGCDECLSDLDAYSRAVKFYFPTATIQFKMEVDLCGSLPKQPKPITMSSQTESTMSMSLDDLLDF